MSVGVIVSPKDSAHHVQAVLKRTAARAVFGTKVKGLPSMWTRDYIADTSAMSTYEVSVRLDEQISTGFSVSRASDNSVPVAL